MAGNSYDEATLLRKDGLREFKEENYLREEVFVANAREAMSPIFNNLVGEGKSRGVIKIDAEGYELPILREIAAVLPAGYSVVIIFENHSRSTEKDEIIQMFGDRARLYEIYHRRVRGAKILRFIKSLLGARISITLKPTPEKNLLKGNYALVIE